jgi:hypothetical protein
MKTSMIRSALNERQQAFFVRIRLSPSFEIPAVLGSEYREAVANNLRIWLSQARRLHIGKSHHAAWD